MTGRKGRVEHTGARFIELMMCLAVSDLPTGSRWKYELKFDGYRAIGFKMRGGVYLMSSNGKNFSQRFRSLALALEALPYYTAVAGSAR